MAGDLSVLTYSVLVPLFAPERKDFVKPLVVAKHDT